MVYVGLLNALAGLMFQRQGVQTWKLECAPQLQHRTTLRKHFHLQRRLVLRVQGGDFPGQELQHQCPEPHKAHENQCVNLRSNLAQEMKTLTHSTNRDQGMRMAKHARLMVLRADAKRQESMPTPKRQLGRQNGPPST